MELLHPRPTVLSTTISHRIAGFDLARAYAIFGMFIVNFNTVFGSHKDPSWLGQFLHLFNGNSSVTFVVLAGMGVALMTNRSPYDAQTRNQIQSVILKRSWFLFAIGLLLYSWWPADILHFYGGYMHIAALLLFAPQRYYLLAAGVAIVGFHALLVIIPYETGWNFETLQYTDFWTVPGFLRNTIYNGWNPLFPWSGFFFLGMWLGRLNWQQPRTKRNVGLIGAVVYGIAALCQLVAPFFLPENVAFYVTADYLPPFLPFMASTAGFAMVVMAVCMYVGERFSGSTLIRVLVKTGQMTLTHYILHLTLGMITLSLLTGKAYTGTISTTAPLAPHYCLLFALSFYLLSVWFSHQWSKRYKRGPLEGLMRTITG